MTYRETKAVDRGQVSDKYHRARPGREEAADKLGGVFIRIWNEPGRQFPEHRVMWLSCGRP